VTVSALDTALHQIAMESDMTAKINGKTFKAKQTNGQFFYWSPRALRWLPVAAAKVSA
jgi:hypothetical protein